jgi:putative transposase
MNNKKSHKNSSITEFAITNRHLPHWQLPNSVYFITTRCIKGIDLTPECCDIIMDSIQYLDGKKYVLHAAVILTDHFHMIIQPMEKDKDAYYSLSEIMHSIKSFTAHKVGKPLWQHENFDRIIRDKEELIEKIKYIMKNPVKAGLTEDYITYKWLFIR